MRLESIEGLEFIAVTKEGHIIYQKEKTLILYDQEANEVIALYKRVRMNEKFYE